LQCRHDLWRTQSCRSAFSLALHSRLVSHLHLCAPLALQEGRLTPSSKMAGIKGGRHQVISHNSLSIPQASAPSNSPSSLPAFPAFSKLSALHSSAPQLPLFTSYGLCHSIPGSRLCDPAPGNCQRFRPEEQSTILAGHPHCSASEFELPLLARVRFHHLLCVLFVDYLFCIGQSSVYL
jgi:hypothetical protein